MSFPPHMPIIPPMPFFPPGAPMMMPPNISTPLPPVNGAVKPPETDKKNRLQTATTVFVGSISDRAPDTMIKRMLHNCGSVVSWKRIQGANGKLQAFGFCEYENPEGTLRCIRLLNGWQIQDKKLVVKVDAKTKALLDEYKKKKRHELAKKAANDTKAFTFVYEENEDDMNSGNTDDKKKSGEEGEIEDEEEHDYIDNETRREDMAIKQSLETIMREYSKEMNQRALEAKEQSLREAATVASQPVPATGPPSSSPLPAEVPTGKRADGNGSLDDDDGKRSLITNEIQMFRDRFKDEETKMRNTEKERKDRYERERAEKRAAEKRAADEAANASNNNDRKSSHSPRSSSRDRSPSRRRDRSSPSDDRYRRSSHASNSVRSRNNDRRGSPSRYDRRSPRSYRRSRTKSPVSKNHGNDEDDDEAYERRRQEKRLKEKEIRYRERLKAWEQRERKKQSEYEAEKRRELARLHDEEKEAKRLLAMLEDYNDENDDPIHYKGAAFTRRLKEREHEIELDNRDRRHEKDEIEELRQKLLLQNDIDDIEIEIKKRLEKEEELIRKRLADLIRPNDESEAESDTDEQSKVVPMDSTSNGKNESMEQSPIQVPTAIETKVSPRQQSALGGAPITGTKIQSKRKLAVNEAFRDEDDENTNGFQKKSKLSAIPDQQTVPTFDNSPQMKDDAINRKSAAPVTPTNNANSAQNQEEKRQAVRKLIESIPTKKEDLFTFPVDWSLLDANLMDKRIKPWVTKKIVEYIGENEPTLIDFICQSIMSKKTPDSILSDIRVVLDDEAEVFVVKMWRLIVYEIEAKRNGLSK